MKRSAAWVAFGLPLAAVAQDSPEVVLALDVPAGSFTSSVKRFDAFTGQQLGEIGRGTLIDPQAMAVLGSTVVVLDRSSFSLLRRFDFHTGRYLGTITVPGVFGGMNATDRGVLLWDGSGLVREYLASGSSFTAGSSWSLPFGGVQSVALSADRSRMAVGAGNRRTVFNTANTGIVADFTALVTFAMGGVIHRGGQWRVAFQGATSTSVGWMDTNNVSPNGMSTSDLVGPVNGLGWGHGDMGYFGSRLASTNQVVIGRMVAQPFGAVYSGFLGEGRLTNVRDVDVYVAPEPGTLIALGAGALGLLARRRRAR